MDVEHVLGLKHVDFHPCNGVLESFTFARVTRGPYMDLEAGIVLCLYNHSVSGITLDPRVYCKPKYTKSKLVEKTSCFDRLGFGIPWFPAGIVLVS